MYFQQFGMELLAEPLVHLKCFLFCFVFCTEVPMDDIKSAVHRLKSFAQDAAQAGRGLAHGVSGESRGLPSGEGCEGEALRYLRNF